MKLSSFLSPSKQESHAKKRGEGSAPPDADVERSRRFTPIPIISMEPVPKRVCLEKQLKKNHLSDIFTIAPHDARL